MQRREVMKARGSRRTAGRQGSPLAPPAARHRPSYWVQLPLPGLACTGTLRKQHGLVHGCCALTGVPHPMPPCCFLSPYPPLHPPTLYPALFYLTFQPVFFHPPIRNHTVAVCQNAMLR